MKYKVALTSFDVPAATTYSDIYNFVYICNFLFVFFVEPCKSSAVDSLFVLDLHGSLTEYVLEPQAVKTVPQSDDTPLELITTARAQWSLTRY